MIQLAIETTGRDGSLAVMDGENLLWKRRSGTQRRTAAELAVDLDAALRWCGENAYELDGISVAVGPGSFTGLRIGVTTAKTLAYALELPVVPVGSLAAIAAVTALPGDVSGVLVGVNAYRRQIFAAEFSRKELHDRRQIDACNHRVEILTREEWDNRAERALECEDLVVSGDRSILADSDAQQMAARDGVDALGVGRIAARLIAAPDPSQSVCADAFSLTARYLKPSAAEEKAALR